MSTPKRLANQSISVALMSSLVSFQVEVISTSVANHSDIGKTTKSIHSTTECKSSWRDWRGVKYRTMPLIKSLLESLSSESLLFWLYLITKCHNITDSILNRCESICQRSHYDCHRHPCWGPRHCTSLHAKSDGTSFRGHSWRDGTSDELCDKF